MQRERVFLQKMNLTLVYVLKQEWPHNWPEFIGEIVQASTTNEVQHTHPPDVICVHRVYMCTGCSAACLRARHGNARHRRKKNVGLFTQHLDFWLVGFFLPLVVVAAASFFLDSRCCARTTCRF